MNFFGGALSLGLALLGLLAIGLGLRGTRAGGLPAGQRYTALGSGAALIAAGVLVFAQPSAGSTGSFTPAPTGAPATTTVPAATSAPAVAPSPSPLSGNGEAAPAPAPITGMSVMVPELRGQTPDEAARQLQELGLQLGEQRPSCAVIGASEPTVAVQAGQLLCQAVAPNSMAPQGFAIDYVLAGGP